MLIPVFERLAEPLTTDNAGVYVRLVGELCSRYLKIEQVFIDSPYDGAVPAKTVDSVVGWQHAIPFNDQYGYLEIEGPTRFGSPVSLTLTTNPTYKK